MPTKPVRPTAISATVRNDYFTILPHGLPVRRAATSPPYEQSQLAIKAALALGPPQALQHLPAVTPRLEMVLMEFCYE
jgi:hypothetical protein